MFALRVVDVDLAVVRRSAPAGGERRSSQYLFVRRRRAGILRFQDDVGTGDAARMEPEMLLSRQNMQTQYQTKVLIDTFVLV